MIEESYRPPSAAERLAGSIWGQLVGDAASLGAHWYYNLLELERIYPNGIKGFEAPIRGHYHETKQPGDQTHYGDGALVMLDSVAERGDIDPVHFGERFFNTFGRATYGGYLDKATRGTLEYQLSWEDEYPGVPFDYQRGADDDQLASASRLAVVVAVHHEDHDLLKRVEEATRVCRNNDRAVAYMKANAILLKELLAGRDVHSCLHRTEERIVREEPELGLEIRRKIRDAMATEHLSVSQATDKLGQSCPLICSFPSAIHAFVKHARDGFETTILEVIRAGGDNAGRAAMAGGWLGAHLGVNAVPLKWRQRLTNRNRIQAAIQQILQ